MLVVRNEDRPGMIGRWRPLLGDAGINIDDMHLGRSAAGAAALMVLATSPAVPPELRDQLRAIDGIESVHVISRSGERRRTGLPSGQILEGRRPSASAAAWSA